jgi:beta-lactamase superfamily II metal-dependent hydrolase
MDTNKDKRILRPRSIVVRRLDVFLSHPSLDEVGGIALVTSAFHVAQIILAASGVKTP